MVLKFPSRVHESLPELRFKDPMGSLCKSTPTSISGVTLHPAGIELNSQPSEYDMPNDRWLFREWIKTSALNTRVRVINKGVERVELILGPDQWVRLEKTVRYELQFDTGDRIWLNDVRLTRVLKEGESTQFYRMEGKTGQEAEAAENSARRAETAVKRLEGAWPQGPATETARSAIKRAGVPRVFAEWAVQLFYENHRWPSVKDAVSQCKERDWKGAKGGNSKSVIQRWLQTIKIERQKVGLDSPTGEDAMRHKTSDHLNDALVHPNPVYEEPLATDETDD